MLKCRLKRLFLVLAIICFPAANLVDTASSQVKKPLPIENKRTLYQRILTRPNTPLTSTPQDSSPIETFRAFEVFYVYESQNIGDKKFIEVGRSLSKGPEGWMEHKNTIPWKHTVVLAFNNPANRDLALIYKTKQKLIETLSQEDVSARLRQLQRDVKNNDLSNDSPIISVEPNEFVDIEEQFYVLPILDHADIRLPNRVRAKMLKIASIPKKEGVGVPRVINREDALKNMRIGVTFVIDTTASMQPYIQAIGKAMGQFRDRIAGSTEADRFRFGLVGFRDNIELTPDIEYVTRTFLPLSENSTATKFVQIIGQVKSSESNSTGYNEDAIAGVMAAADGMDWQPFAARFIILITDAGPRTPGDDANQGHLAPREVANYLHDKQIALFTMHLKSEAGKFDHEYAENSYVSMSRFGGQILYFPIQNADTQALQTQVNAVSSQLLQLVTATIEQTLGEAQSSQDQTSPDTNERVNRVFEAMRLAYLGRVSDSQVPDVFEGWLTDRDPLDRFAFPVSPYMLMSRNQLSTLRDVMLQAVELGTSREGTSDDFFVHLRSIFGSASRGAHALSEAGTLGDLLAEYLDGLPYNSEIFGITEADWRRMSALEERQLIDGIRSKIAALERVHNNTARWHPISPDAPDGEHVTLVPLSLLP